jgi:toxin CptA
MLLPWLPVAASLQVALGLAIVASLGWQAASQVLRIAPGSLRSLTWQQGRDCRLELAGGGRLSATLEPYAFVQPWLVIIAYRVRRWPARYLLILPDMLDADTRRRLRVRLRMELPRHA